MRLFDTGLCAGLLMASCAGPSEPARNAAALDPGLDLGDPGLTLGEPVQVENLTVWPVLRVADAAAPRVLPVRYVPLDDALRAGDARVLEKGDVNELVIVNEGALPVLCLSGEVLEGGQQDRIVAKDVVIEPGETADLASFCVEQGRWHTEAGDASDGTVFRSAELFVASNVKAAAQVSADQGAVWSNVSRAQRANAVQSDTGAYLALRDSAQLNDQVGARAEAVLAALAGVEGAVGLVAAIDLGGEDEFVTGEVFGDAALCAAYRKKLVHAYALDSLSQEVSRDALFADALSSDQRGLGQLDTLGYHDVDPDLEVQASGGWDPGGAPSGGLFTSVAAQRSFLRNAGAGAGGPGVVVREQVVEAGNADLKHVHRTLYKRAPSDE